MPYRTFVVYNVAGGIIWGVGYCLLGYLAGSAYSVIESRVGAGLAIAVAVAVVAAAAAWALRRHRGAARAGAASGDEIAEDGAPLAGGLVAPYGIATLDGIAPADGMPLEPGDLPAD